ncbi:MAG: helix-turn-helix domain-containing protein [Cyanobacteria bacterium]|nr:helix-turn-helix domain-containing protein [Cyanobacteriota bacterium]
MPAARLSDSQKAEVVERFRAGEGLQPLAEIYGCSPNTVSRAVKAALEPGEYDRIKERNRRSATPRMEPADPVVLELTASHGEEPAGDGQGDDDGEGEGSGRAEAAAIAFDRPAGDPDTSASPTSAAPVAAWFPAAAIAHNPPRRLIRRSDQRPPAAAPAADREDGPAVLAIDDADDFGDDESDDDLALDVDADDSDGQSFVPVPLLEVVDDHTEIRPLPLTAADLRGSAWMLVDKTVELQAKPLSEFTELGRLPAEEQDRQALMVFVNPRQAKRHCGRTQRVIKIPDPAVFTLTAPYLLAQGISRVVIEGALFALPGS